MPPSFLPLQHLFIYPRGIGSLGIPFCPISFTYNDHCNDLLVWFKVFGFRYTIFTEPPLKLLSYFPRLPGVMEILQLSFHRTTLFRSSNRS